ncbi:MAG: hypothetical protein D3917_15840 [Candidatus Electrothrix sp. AX5]|nr:hypothetical protein [Candidatus Electrothrix sp. AX5]
MKYHLTNFMVLLIVTLLSAEVAYADWRDKIFIHGFGGWMYGQTDNENEHFLGGWDSEGNADCFNFSLNIRGELSENLVVYFQPSFEEINGNKEATVDYVFAEWFISDLFTIRAGKVKAPLMLLNEIHDVGTVRPFLLNPIGVYSDSTAENFQGIGLTGVYYPDFESDWLFSYDIYAGFTDIGEYVYKVRGGGTSVERWTINEMLGGRFFIQPPIDGLRFGISSYIGKQEYSYTERGNINRYDLGDAYVVGGSIEYLSPQWELRGEYLMMTKNSESYNDDTQEFSTYEEQRNTFYLEAAYRLTEHWQVAARYEVLDYPDYNSALPPSHPFQESKEFSFGVNYWVRPNLVMKLSTTLIQGNNNVRPDDVWKNEFLEDQSDILLNEDTVLTLFGIQFSF